MGDRRRTRSGRARTRAVREHAAAAGVPYSVAARQLGSGPGEVLASRGRTVYPAGGDDDRRAWVLERSERSFAECVRDARLAADIPVGRAVHLVRRFPPTRGRPGTGVGPLYHGEGRADLLAMVLSAVCHEAPGFRPSTGELAWTAELGEETVVDMACSDLDRAARLLLDADHATIWRRLESALLASGQRRLHRLFEHMLSSVDDGPPLTGARQILDATLVVAEDGHAPGTRVRMLTAPYTDLPGTIVGVHWAACGPPLCYQVRPDGGHAVLRFDPRVLMVLPHQEALPGAEPHADAPR